MYFALKCRENQILPAIISIITTQNSEINIILVNMNLVTFHLADFPKYFSLLFKWNSAFQLFFYSFDLL